MKIKNILLVIPMILLLAACSKLTKENYDKLEVGMSQNEVQAIIGSSDNCTTTLGTVSCVWGDEKGKHIKVRFVADAAVTFSNDAL